MFPDPGRQAAQRAAQPGAEQSARQAAQDGMRAAQLGPAALPPVRGAAAVSCPSCCSSPSWCWSHATLELRASVLHFVHHVVNVVQNRADGS
ncbi:hypothetical protein ACRAWF_10020 [Streptomyces sp. L7]